MLPRKERLQRREESDTQCVNYWKAKMTACDVMVSCAFVP